jgi:alkylation response protein AidB-like acyl-CoA dehydrogenase
MQVHEAGDSASGEDGLAMDRAAVLDLVAGLVESLPPEKTEVREFLRARYDAGLAWVWFPVGFGGLGLASELQTLADQAVAAAGGPNTTVGSVGYMMTASAVVTYGTDEQKRRFLPKIYIHDGDWVQLFSEPGAGSDLAGLSTRAERDGDEWVVNGQKVWSSGGVHADWGLLVARTDPAVPKHNGLSVFLVDMHTAGVEARPIRNMVGSGEFAEVFFTDARIPDTMRIGGVNDGWRVALTVLMNERVNFTADFAGAEAPRPDQPFVEARRLLEGRAAQDPVRRDRFMRLWVDFEVVRLNNLRAAQRAKAGNPGPEGSIGKVASTELTKRVAGMAMELLGPEGMILPTRYPLPGEPDPSRSTDDPRFNFLATPSNTIMGGTSEIQRNNIAERILGLPGDVRVDKGIPWRDVPRST